MTESKTCQTCGRKLPMSYKYKKCESCRTKKINKVKGAGKVALGIGAALGSLALTAASLVTKKIGK